REVGARQVVVDRLGYADHVDADVGQLGRDTEGVLTTDRDERVDLVRLEVGLDPLDAALDLERVGARRPEDGAAAREDATNLRDAERAGDVLQRPAPAVPKPDEVEFVLADALAHDSPDDRVQPWAVAASGEYS